jgi:hypothetical protein
VKKQAEVKSETLKPRAEPGKVLPVQTKEKVKVEEQKTPKEPVKFSQAVRGL